MTTQHAPHTPPLWRQFLSLPRTRPGWWAVGLSAPALVLSVYFPLSVVFGWMFLRPAVAEGGSSDQYPILTLAWMLSILAGAFVGLPLLLTSQERSWLVWLAMVPILIPFHILVWAVLGLNDGPVVTVPVTALLLILAVTAFWFGKRIGFFTD